MSTVTTIPHARPETSMRKLTRTETIHWLLETLRDVADPLQAAGAPGEGAGSIAMPHAYRTGSYPEIIRCLHLARDTPGQPRRHWHTLRHRYLLCPDQCCYLKTAPIIRIVKSGNTGRTHRIDTGKRQLVRRYNPSVTPQPESREGRQRLQDAISWISSELQGEAFLPDEIWRTVTGQPERDRPAA
jgi:hypothetical protein